MKDLGSIEGGDIMMQKESQQPSTKNIMPPPSATMYHEKASNHSSNLLTTMKDLKMMSNAERESQGNLNNSVALTNQEKEGVPPFRQDTSRNGLVPGHYPVLTGSQYAMATATAIKKDTTVG